jgi:hypothetical protein
MIGPGAATVKSAARTDPITALAPGSLIIYTFFVHNLPSARPAALRFSRAASASSKTTVRRALRGDAGSILELVSQYAAQGLMLPRTFEQNAARIDN